VKEQRAHLAKMEASHREWIRHALIEERSDVSTGNQTDTVAYTHAYAHETTVEQHTAELVVQRRHTLEVIGSIPLE
jgi:hypothetical protein